MNKTTNTVNIMDAHDFMKNLIDLGDVTQGEKQEMMTRLVHNKNWTWVTKAGKRFLITEEVINCDCGKGLYCPLVKVAPATKTGHVRKWMWAGVK